MTRKEIELVLEEKLPGLSAVAKRKGEWEEFIDSHTKENTNGKKFLDILKNE